MKNSTHSHNLKSRHQTEPRESGKARSLSHLAPHFQANTLSGACGRPAKFDRVAFYKLSNHYFAEEAPRSFALEAGIFAALITMALLPIASGLQAVATMIHSIALF